MSTLLLDASVILAAFDSDDELHGPSQTLLADPDVTLTTLDLARYEVANGPAKAKPSSAGRGFAASSYRHGSPSCVLTVRCRFPPR